MAVFSRKNPPLAALRAADVARGAVLGDALFPCDFMRKSGASALPGSAPVPNFCGEQLKTEENLFEQVPRHFKVTVAASLTIRLEAVNAAGFLGIFYLQPIARAMRLLRRGVTVRQRTSGFQSLNIGTQVVQLAPSAPSSRK